MRNIFQHLPHRGKFRLVHKYFTLLLFFFNNEICLNGYGIGQNNGLDDMTNKRERNVRIEISNVVEILIRLIINSLGSYRVM